MFIPNILNSPKFDIDNNLLSKIFELINTEVSKKQNGILNIIFVSENEIKELNKNYRGKDYVTDVLSFHYYDDFTNLNDIDIAGELVFCEKKINIQATEYGLGEEKEFYKLFIHSILHILGYDHEKDDDYIKMNNLENIIWGKIFDN